MSAEVTGKGRHGQAWRDDTVKKGGLSSSIPALMLLDLVRQHTQLVRGSPATAVQYEKDSSSLVSDDTVANARVGRSSGVMPHRGDYERLAREPMLIGKLDLLQGYWQVPLPLEAQRDGFAHSGPSSRTKRALPARILPVLKDAWRTRRARAWPVAPELVAQAMPSHHPRRECSAVMLPDAPERRWGSTLTQGREDEVLTTNLRA